jgi:hypothetical protein
MLDSLRQMPSWQRAGETGPPVDLYETDKAVIIRLVLAHSRRRLVHFNVTEHPTAEWMARQLLDACALEEGPRYLIGLRQNLWRAIFASGQDAGNPGGRHCAALTMAKRICRAGDWLDSPGMP